MSWIPQERDVHIVCNTSPLMVPHLSLKTHLWLINGLNPTPLRFEPHSAWRLCAAKIAKLIWTHPEWTWPVCFRLGAIKKDQTGFLIFMVKHQDRCLNQTAWLKEFHRLTVGMYKKRGLVLFYAQGWFKRKWHEVFRLSYTALTTCTCSQQHPCNLSAPACYTSYITHLLPPSTTNISVIPHSL